MAKATRKARSATVAATVGDLLALPDLAGARAVPSDADLSAAIRGMEPVTDRESVAAGTVLVAGDRMPGAVPTGCVAVVSTVTPSDPLDVPVVLLGSEVDWSAVLVAIAQAIAGPEIARAASVRLALRQAVLSGGGYPAVAECALQTIQRPIAFLDAYLDMLGSAGVSEERVDQLAETVEDLRAGGSTDALTSFLERGVDSTVMIPIHGSTGLVGAIVVWDPDGIDPNGPVIGEVMVACAVESARDEARLEAESRLRGELLEELISGGVVDRESIVRRARLLGADLSNGAVGMIGTVTGPDDTALDDRAARRFVSQVRGVLDVHWPRALADWMDGKLMVLLPTPPDADGAPGVDERAHALARRLLSATRESVPGAAVTLALSRPTREPERLGAALDEAELALSIGARLGRAGEVVTFEETGTYKLLFQIFADRPEELTAFYESTLAPLVAYDEQYQTELVGTLATYLELDGNLAATAATLYTHRHTVRYRLDRIAELAGLDVGKSDDREKLSLGLKAMRLLGRSVRSGPADERAPRGRR